MEFRFTVEQQAFADSVARTLDAHCPLSEVRALMEQPLEGLHRGAWTALAELGVQAAAVPQDSGGLGAGPMHLAAAAESIGARLAPVPMASSIYGCALTLADLQPDNPALADLASGAKIGTVAFESSIDVKSGRAFGSAPIVMDGDVADLALVLARDADGASVYAVQLASPNVRRCRLKTLDGSKPAAAITFDGTPATRIGPAGRGPEIIEGTQRRSAIFTACEQVGGAQAALDAACAYAHERRAFGRPIGAQQAVKHALSDVWCALEIARGHVYYALCALDRSLPDLTLAADVACASATRAYAAAARASIHIHGAQGFTWANDAHLYYRRARALASAYGAERACRERIADALFAGVRPDL